MTEITRIPVGDAYPVLVGPGAREQIGAVLPSGASRVLVVHGSPLRALAEPVAASLTAAGLEVHLAAVPDAEAAKTVDVAQDLWSQMGQAGFTRGDLVVTVGGGSVTDLGGWAAAAWLRGVAVIHVPTTVLAMVDAAVGGKAGVNTAEGKNLVGAFHEPLAVLCDTAVLGSLPPADLAAGLAEVVKGGFIADPVILDLIEEDPAAAQDPTSPVLRELIERKIAVKAAVVAADLRESHLREILNYGHTLGHAIEHHEDYRMRHGDAVAIGMVFAAELAHRLGSIDAALLARHRRVLGLLGLPTAYDEASFEDLLQVMARDKKTRGSTLRFVTLEGLGQPTRVAGPDEAILRASYAALAERPSRAATGA